MRKILVSLLTLGAVLVIIPMFAAWEAHVINVTAQIENALNVPLDSIDFGTVFPQEHLEKDLTIALSGSFQSEDRTDAVDYIIRQKPKCAVTEDNGETIVGETWTGHVQANGTAAGATIIDCNADRPDGVEEGAELDTYLLPSLCEYISKHPDQLEGNDGSLDSFHQPWEIVEGEVVWNDVNGRLAKSDDDLEDIWTIDLAVPCFGGSCAQDWADFVTGINPEADPADYVQDIDDEHKIFGCNLWVEVTGVDREEEDGVEEVVSTVGEGWSSEATSGTLGTDRWVAKARHGDNLAVGSYETEVGFGPGLRAEGNHVYSDGVGETFTLTFDDTTKLATVKIGDDETSYTVAGTPSSIGITAKGSATNGTTSFTGAELNGNPIPDTIATLAGHANTSLSGSAVEGDFVLTGTLTLDWISPADENPTLQIDVLY